MEWAADGIPVRRASERNRRTSASSRGETAQPRGFRTKIWTASAVSASARSNARETPPAMPSWAPRIMAGASYTSRVGAATVARVGAPVAGPDGLPGAARPGRGRLGEVLLGVPEGVVHRLDHEVPEHRLRHPEGVVVALPVDGVNDAGEEPAADQVQIRQQ